MLDKLSHLIHAYQMNSMLKLFGNRVLVEPIDDGQGPHNGIFMPQTSIQKHPVGIVRQLGIGTHPDMAEYRVGQMVRLDHSHGSVDCMIKGKLHRIHAIEDVIAEYELE